MEFESTLELGAPPEYGDRALAVEIGLGDVMPLDGSHIPYVMNKAWHAPTSQWVRWATVQPDQSGLQYPGPGTFAECTDFKLEVVTYKTVE